MAERTHDPTEQGDLEELHSLVRSFDWAQFITRGADGHFHARPMALQPPDDDGLLWFVTWRDSQKCVDLTSDSRCGLALHDLNQRSSWVSISGTGEVLGDRRLLDEKWRPAWTLWFPAGPRDPDVVLIRFTPEYAEYVHPATGRLKVLWSMAKSLITGIPAEPAPRRTLDLRH